MSAATARAVRDHTYLGARRAALRWRPWVGIGLLALAYAVAARLGQQFATAPGNVTAVWPASGVALGAILLYGRWLWPGVASGAVLGSASLAASPLAAGFEGIAATTQVLVAGYLLQHIVSFRLDLTTLRSVLAFLLAVVAGASLAAVIGVGGLLAAGIIGPADYVPSTVVWLVGDALGALVVAPLILTLGSDAPDSRARPVEAAAALLGLAFVAQAIFVGFGDSLVPGGRGTFAVVPLIVWAAIRLGPRGAAMAVALLSLFVVTGTLQRIGPFSGGLVKEDLVIAQAFVAVIAGTALALAAVTAERSQASDALERQQHFLEAVLENLGDGIVASDAEGHLTLFNRPSRELHRLPAEAIPPERWADHYDLYHADGTTRLQRDEIPLYRALKGERVRDQEMVVAPKDAAARRLIASASRSSPRTGGHWAPSWRYTTSPNGSCSRSS